MHCGIRSLVVVGIVGLLLAGCQGSQTVAPGAATQPGGEAAVLADQKPVLFLGGQAIGWSALAGPLVEASGGQVLSELVLDRQIARRLAERGVQLDAGRLQKEEELLGKALDADPNQATRLLQELRQRRGLGDQRFASLVARNAGLRLLVQEEVKVSEAAIKEEFELQYGARYEVRLIVTPTLAEAGDVVRRAKAGESFVDLAIRHSVDSSRAQGGLLSPLSPADANFPAGVRAAAARLEVGGISDPVSLERGFAVLKLERKIDAKAVKYDDVKESLAQQVRLRVERMLMQRLAKTILSEADLVILDPALQKSWEQQKRLMAEAP